MGGMLCVFKNVQQHPWQLPTRCQWHPPSYSHRVVAITDASRHCQLSFPLTPTPSEGQITSVNQPYSSSQIRSLILENNDQVLSSTLVHVLSYLMINE